MASKKMWLMKDLASLVGDGIIGGVGATVSFLPLIVVLYFGISLLETTGYMSRVAFFVRWDLA